MERGNWKLRLIDEWIGPVLVLVLSFIIPRSKSRPTQFARIGLIKTAAIGDTVLLSAIVSDLRRAFPSAHIVLFAGSSNAEFAKTIAGLSSVVRLKLTSVFRCLKLIRAERLDLCIDVDSWPRVSALFAGLSRAQWRIGFRTQGQRRHFLFDQVVDHKSDQHEIENYRALVAAIGLQANSTPQDFSKPWAGQGSKTIALHPWPGGTKSYLKEWPIAHWSSLVERLSNQGFDFAVTGGPTDREKTVAFIEAMPETAKMKNLAGLSMNETLSALRSSRLLISVNTGIMHVGAAMGVPTVGLHGPTNVKRWGPVGARVRSVSSKMPGAGQLNLGFEYSDDTNFMNGIDVAEVTRAAQDLLGAKT